MFRRRTTAFILVMIGHALLVLMLLRLTPSSPPPGPAATTFELIPDPLAKAETQPRQKAEAKEVERPAPPSPAAPPPAELPYELDIIPLTRAEYAASDIAKLPSNRPEASPAEAAGASASAEAAGTGPNGERLYRAEWYREPTQAELAYYLPNGGPRGGWAMIACQTVADFRVENCVEIGQSPAGSGLASAIREAAWQFRVWPPRIGGRPLVGAWVRIRIEFTPDPAG